LTDKELWAAYKANPNDTNRNAIIVRYMPLIEQIAAVFLRNPINRAVIQKEELCSAGVFGILTAIRKYDPRRGRFETFAYLPVRWHMNKECHTVCGKTVNRSTNPDSSETLRSTRQGIGGEYDVSSAAVYTEDVSRNLQRQDLMRLIERRKGLLSDKELEFLDLHYRDGLTRRECQKVMRVSHQRVGQYAVNIKKLLRLATAGHEGEFET